MYTNKKIDLWSLAVPLWQIAHLRGPVAFIMTPGRQIIIRKLPSKREYFIDKELGLFQIKPEVAFFINKTAVYFYDMRNQNPIDPAIMNELWKWANFQGIYKIRRVDVEQAKKLRAQGGNIAKLKEDQEAVKRQTRTFMSEVLAKIKIENKNIENRQKQEVGTESETDEYTKYSEEDSNFVIVKNLYDHGYIDAKQAGILNHKLTTRELQSTDDLLKEIESFTDVYVSLPITNEMERILDEYHTYRPRDVINIVQQLSKIKRGLGNLRTKPVINWFPATYLLFGALGVGIVIMLYFTYGQQAVSPTDIIPKHP